MNSHQGADRDGRAPRTGDRSCCPSLGGGLRRVRFSWKRLGARGRIELEYAFLRRQSRFAWPPRRYAAIAGNATNPMTRRTISCQLGTSLMRAVHRAEDRRRQGRRAAFHGVRRSRERRAGHAPSLHPGCAKLQGAASAHVRPSRLLKISLRSFSQFSRTEPRPVCAGSVAKVFQDLRVNLTVRDKSPEQALTFGLARPRPDVLFGLITLILARCLIVEGFSLRGSSLA
jgi:hypothetical protein